MVLSAPKCTKVLLYDRHGRPFLKGIPFLHLSLSLSLSLSVLVASDLRDKKQMIVVTGMGVKKRAASSTKKQNAPEIPCRKMNNIHMSLRDF
jgi:hypothetical protein